jgi:hypothetical protein
MPRAGFQLRRTGRGSISHIEISGTIDETFDRHTLPRKASHKTLILNLAQVRRFSSFGVREWTRAMRSLSQELSMYWLECSPATVAQLNAVANFAGNAVIISVEAPFYCESCRAESSVTCKVERGHIPPLPQVTCADCGSPMRLEDPPESYFEFLLRPGPPHVIDPAVPEFLENLKNDPLDRSTSSSGMPAIDPRPVTPPPSPIPSFSVPPVAKPKAIAQSRAPSLFLRLVTNKATLPIVAGLAVLVWIAVIMVSY